MIKEEIKMKVPEVRFEGYEGEWERKSLSDKDFEIIAGGDIDNNLIKSNGEYPVIANALRNEGIVGYYNNHYRVKAPAVTVTGRGDIGIAKARTVNFTPIVRLLSIRSKHNIYFLENAINNHKVLVESTGVPQLTVPQLSKYEVQFPKTINEENDIGTLFQQLDNQISHHRTKLQKLQHIKQAMLTKMFPQDGAKVPEVRFEGFEGEWERKKLREIGSTFSGLSGKTKADFGHGKARYITYMNVFSNPIANPKQLDLIEIDDTQNKVQYGDVLFTTSSETPEEVGMSSVWLQNMENIYLNSFCFGYRPDIDINNEFLAYLLRSDSIRDKFIFLAQGISRYNISKTRVMDISLPLPSVQEQSQIGTLFHQLDNQISHHRTKLQKLQHIKQAMLTKMFPQDGANVPEVRFEGFEGEWERKKLGDAFNFLPNNTLSRANLNYNVGLALNVHYGDVLIKFGETLHIDKDIVPFITDNDIANKLLPSKLQSGDIIFADTAEDETVGKCTELINVNNKVVYAGLHTIPVRPTSEFGEGYLGYFLNAPAYHDQLLKLIQGIKVLAISKTAIKDTLVHFPKDKTEQSQIGSFFQQLDTLLAQHQKQLDKLGQIKSALLDKLFV